MTMWVTVCWQPLVKLACFGSSFMFMELRKHILGLQMQHGLILYTKSEWSVHGPFCLLKWSHKELARWTPRNNAYYIEDGNIVVNTAASWFESQVWWHMGVLQQMLQNSFRYTMPTSCAAYFLLCHLQTAYHSHFMTKLQCHWNIIT